MKTDKLMLNGILSPLALPVILFLMATMHPLSAALAASDTYPAKPVRLVINFAPGGSTDAIGRLIAIKLSERLGKQFISESRSGAGGILGAETVAKSTPDGYTLLFSIKGED